MHSRCDKDTPGIQSRTAVSEECAASIFMVEGGFSKPCCCLRFAMFAVGRPLFHLCHSLCVSACVGCALLHRLFSSQSFDLYSAGERGLDLSGSLMGLLAGCCGCRNEPSGFIEFGNFLSR
jgi:hypothetical protein